MIIGTVSSASRLPSAMILAKSVKKHMRESKVVVGIIEDSMPSEALIYPYFDEVVLIKDLGTYPDMQKFFFQYTAEEATRACRAPMMKHIYNKYTDEHLMLYMDAETKVVSPLEELAAAAANHPIILIGNVVHPETLDMDWLSGIRHRGIYHPGFLALKRHPDAERFLSWWSKLSENNSYYDHGSKRFADQAWLDLTHTLFDDVYALRHNGYLVTAENIMERWNIHQVSPEAYTIDGQPLRSIHVTDDFLHATSWIDSERGELFGSLFQDYSEERKGMAQRAVNSAPWSYSRFAGGEPIEDQTKEMFRRHYYVNPEIDNPFLLSNAFFTGEQRSVEAPSLPALLPKSKPVMQARRRRLRRKKEYSVRKKRRASSV
ncbi:hypothetical protein [Paenibacillus sp. FJAT-27812]|uniref:hypothetical protein n=1 Tax=Paenibacillus sp. FJAT-27812 TaxID=1684143 RepID=UPI0006A7E710|nr:hypothetical protein [Paenibacillus sp. FJAT-27812]